MPFVVYLCLSGWVVFVNYMRTGPNLAQFACFTVDA